MVSGTAVAEGRARDFVETHGDALARHRAGVLAGSEDAAAALAMLEPWDSRELDTRRRVLELCEELRALRSLVARRSLAALEVSQACDGAFAPESLPPASRLELTGNLGGILARSPFGRPECLEAAGDFLARHFDPDLLQGFQWHNIAAYARFFANTLHDAADEVLQWCGRELERGFRAHEFDALATAHLFVLCDAHGVPGATLDREELLLGLLAEQAPDGGFGNEKSADRVELSLRGLRALCFLAGTSGALDSRPAAR